MNAENLAAIDALCADLERLARSLQIIGDELREIRDDARASLRLTPIRDERQLPIAA